MNSPDHIDRVRSFGYFVIAIVYFFFAELIASHSAAGLASGVWKEPIHRAMLLFLLLLGYGLMGRAFQRQAHPIASMGIVFRLDWKREFGVGAALGWGMLLATILPTVLFGGLIVTVWTSLQQYYLLVLDLVVLALGSLAEEVVFRGYPFQRLIDAIGPFLATVSLSVIFAAFHAFNPNVNRMGLLAAVFAGWLLSVAYLRTRALWLSWGWHFAWNVSMAILFGLPLSGLTRFSPVIQSNTIGSPWITGGDYGPEGSIVCAVVLLIGLPVLFRATRSYAHKYAQPEIIPGDMPVNLDAMGRVVAPHHGVAADGDLVRIQPTASSPVANDSEADSHLTHPENPVEYRSDNPNDVTRE
jgi:membrane protease YdiL (CAAX protease family)